MTYGNNQDCRWSLKAPVGQRIILEQFKINTDQCGECTCDYLVIKAREEPKSKTNSFNKKYCGSKDISRIESEDNTLFLHFHSDATVVKKGFRISYHSK